MLRGVVMDYNDLDDLARNYYANDKNNSGKSLKKYFEVFNIKMMQQVILILIGDRNYL